MKNLKINYKLIKPLLFGALYVGGVTFICTSALENNNKDENKQSAKNSETSSITRISSNDIDNGEFDLYSLDSISTDEEIDTVIKKEKVKTL